MKFVRGSGMVEGRNLGRARLETMMYEEIWGA